jgi:DNA-binding response OmpR family regulator
VLLACGDPSLSETLERVLRGHGEDVAPAGVAVRRVHDGVACLQALEMGTPDLLVLHSALDRMSGAEVLQAWRSAHPGERLPVLVLSSLYLSDLTPELYREESIALPCDNLDLVERAARLLLETS